jgi:hypothetical protein
MLSLVRTFFVG